MPIQNVSNNECWYKKKKNGLLEKAELKSAQLW